MSDNEDFKNWLDERFDRQSDQLKALDDKVEDRFNSLDKKVDHNRANADMQFASISNTLDKHRTWIVELQLQDREEKGSRTVWDTLRTVVVAIAGALFGKYGVGWFH